MASKEGPTNFRLTDAASLIFRKEPAGRWAVKEVLNATRAHAKEIGSLFNLKLDPLHLDSVDSAFFNFFIQKCLAIRLAQQPFLDPSLDPHLSEFPSLPEDIEEELQTAYRNIARRNNIRLTRRQLNIKHAPLREAAELIVGRYFTNWGRFTIKDREITIDDCFELTEDYKPLPVPTKNWQENMAGMIRKHPKIAGGLAAAGVFLAAGGPLYAVKNMSGLPPGLNRPSITRQNNERNEPRPITLSGIQNNQPPLHPKNPPTRLRPK